MSLLDDIFKKKDKTKPDFSNVTSGHSSTAPQPAAGGTVATPPPAAERRTYVVKEGDSLSKIAKHLYGDGNQWLRIYEANRAIIKNPDLIYPGQELHIP